MWSARHTHCVFHVHDLFVSFGAVCGRQGIHTVFYVHDLFASFGAVCGRQGIHTVFSMFMTRLSHLVLYVVGKVEYQVSSHEDYCKAYIQHFPCSCCGLMKNTPGPTYCVFPVHVVE